MPKNDKKKQTRSQVQKHLGQHLLHNKRIINKIISLANIKQHELVVDIGAGLGALALPISEKADHVLAVEKDPVFATKLQSKTESKINVQVVQQDFLSFSLPNRPFCVVASIPYSITTPILNHLLDRPTSSLQRAVLIIEKGAAKRFTNKPLMNPRTLTWRMWFDLMIGDTITAKNFAPPPRVDSAVFIIQRKKNLLIPPAQQNRFTALVSYGLKFPKLPIGEVLKGIFTAPQITHLLRNIRADRHDMICSLNEHQWAIVFLTMIQYVKSYHWPKVLKRKPQ